MLWNAVISCAVKLVVAKTIMAKTNTDFIFFIALKFFNLNIQNTSRDINSIKVFFSSYHFYEQGDQLPLALRNMTIFYVDQDSIKAFTTSSNSI